MAKNDADYLEFKEHVSSEHKKTHKSMNKLKEELTSITMDVRELTVTMRQLGEEIKRMSADTCAQMKDANARVSELAERIHQTDVSKDVKSLYENLAAAKAERLDFINKIESRVKALEERDGKKYQQIWAWVVGGIIGLLVASAPAIITLLAK